MTFMLNPKNEEDLKSEKSKDFFAPSALRASVDPLYKMLIILANFSKMNNFE